MPDVLRWRAKFGVLSPSTNTVVQPDFDALRADDFDDKLSGHSCLLEEL